MVTSSSSDRAGCNVRNIFPRHAAAKSPPSSCPSVCLIRSADTASSAGSSRTKLVLAATAGAVASNDPCRLPVTINWPETLRAEFMAGNESCPDTFPQKMLNKTAAQPKSHGQCARNMVRLWPVPAWRVCFQVWQWVWCHCRVLWPAQNPFWPPVCNPRCDSQ